MKEIKDEDKTKEQLIRELKKIRKRVAELEALEDERNQEGQKRTEALKMAVGMIELSIVHICSKSGGHVLEHVPLFIFIP